MNVINEPRRDRDRLDAARRVEPAVSAAEAEHFGDAIAVVQFKEERADDVVEARAQAPAGHDAGARLLRVEEEPLARAREFELQVRDRHRFRSALGCGYRR